jgi:hypothetical protein
MVIRPSQNLLQSLRLALAKLEHGLDPTEGADAMAEIKRLILVSITELEFLNALQQANGRSYWTASHSRSPELMEVGDGMAR